MRNVVLCRMLPLLFLITASPALRADATIRYSSQMKFAAFLPPEITEQVMHGSGAQSSDQTIQMKGNKAYSKSGNLTCITDFNTQELTFIDPGRKQIATVPAKQFTDSLAIAMPDLKTDERKAFESAKVTSSSRITGRTEVILGVQAEEREIVLSIEIPLPEGMEQSGPAMKYVMRIWTPKPEEILRVPPLRELTGYGLWTNYFINPLQGIQKIFGGMGLGQDFLKPLEELSQNNSMFLKMHTELYVPLMAQLGASLVKAGKPLPAGFDANSPFFEMNQEARELSAAPIDESIFRLPADYQQVPVKEIIGNPVPGKVVSPRKGQSGS